MSFDDDVLAGVHVDLFDAFGVDGTVQRGLAAPAPVRIIVDRGAERLGEFGQVVGRVDTVSFLCAQWQPQQGDVVHWEDRHGTHDKAVESLLEDDGFAAKAVLYG